MIPQIIMIVIISVRVAFALFYDLRSEKSSEIIGKVIATILVYTIFVLLLYSGGFFDCFK